MHRLWKIPYLLWPQSGKCLNTQLSALIKRVGLKHMVNVTLLFKSCVHVTGWKCGPAESSGKIPTDFNGSGILPEVSSSCLCCRERDTWPLHDPARPSLPVSNGTASSVSFHSQRAGEFLLNPEDHAQEAQGRNALALPACEAIKPKPLHFTLRPSLGSSAPSAMVPWQDPIILN